MDYDVDNGNGNENKQIRSKIETVAWLVTSALLGLGILFTAIIMTAQSTAEKVQKEVTQNRAFLCAIVEGRQFPEDNNAIIRQALEEHCVRFNAELYENETN